MTAENIRVVIAGGGTGGHVFPALAVADQLRAMHPQSEVLFVGSRGGLEERLVPARGYPLHLLNAGKLRGVSVLARGATLLRLPAAGFCALRVLDRFSPHVVVGLGGYASAPVAVAAAMMRLPMVLLEQNAVPGTTNRLLARLADVVVISFRRAARWLPPDRTLLMGNPVRAELVEALSISTPKEGPPCLLVLGGSQGAHAINELMTRAAPELKERVPELRIIHQSGSADHHWVQQRYSEAGVPARVEPFIEDMVEVYREAHLVVGRSGATTLAELCVAGLPALLIPYPYAADDHQAENAMELVEAGGAVMVRQEDLTSRQLTLALAGMLTDEDRLLQMASGMRRCGHPDAARAIVQMLIDRFVRRAQGGKMREKRGKKFALPDR